MSKPKFKKGDEVYATLWNTSFSGRITSIRYCYNIMDSDGSMRYGIRECDLAQRQQREAGADGNPETSAPAKEGA